VTFSSTVEVIKNAPLAVNFATLYMSGKVISNKFFSLFLIGSDILLYMFYKLGDLKPPIQAVYVLHDFLNTTF
jgi:hypothetical protein